MKPASPPAPAPWSGRLLCAGVAASWLLYSGSLSEVFGLPKLAALAAGTLGALALLLPHAARRPTPLDAPLLAGALALAAACLAGPDRYAGLVGVYSQYSDGLFAFALCALVFFAAAAGPLAARPLTAVQAVAAAAGAAGAFAALQAAGVSLGPAREFAGGRVGGTFGDPVPLGAALAAGLPCALALARAGGAGHALAAAAVVWGLLASGSRGALASAGAGAAVWAWLEFRDRPRLRRAVLAAALLAVAGGGAFVASRRAAGTADSARVELWRTAGKVFAAHPWLGAGPGRFQAAMRLHRTPRFIELMGPRRTQVHAHNDWLHAAAAAGLLGLAAWLWLHWGVWACLRAGLADPAARSAAAAAAGALAALFVQAKVNPLPLGAFAAGALLVGALARGEARRAPASVPALGAALAGVVLVAALRLSAADADFARARRAAAAGRGREALAAFEAATARNPREVFYRLEFGRFLHAAAARGPEPERRALLERAAAQGAAAVLLRPAEPDGWAMRGTYLMSLGAAGGPERTAEARDALREAARLDPHSPAVRENLALLEGRP